MQGLSWEMLFIDVPQSAPVGLLSVYELCC